MNRQIVICMQQRYAPTPMCCANNGSIQLLAMVRESLETSGVRATVMTGGCMGMCQHGPNMKLMPDGLVWNRAGSEQVMEVIKVLNGMLSS